MIINLFFFKEKFGGGSELRNYETENAKLAYSFIIAIIFIIAVFRSPNLTCFETIFGSRPSSPLADVYSAGLRAHRHAQSPMETARSNQPAGYFSQPGSANSTSGKRPETPQVSNQTPRPTHLRQNSSIDGLTPGGLPSGSPVIKIIHNADFSLVACLVTGDGFSWTALAASTKMWYDSVIS